jgi:mersacidin/lichenicidin family type 2 lantibiotic
MSRINIIRAWKDEAYRMSLSEEERAQLPGNPAGAMDLNAAELSAVAGGMMPIESGIGTCTVRAGLCCSSGSTCDTSSTGGCG